MASAFRAASPLPRPPLCVLQARPYRKPRSCKQDIHKQDPYTQDSLVQARLLPQDVLWLASSSPLLQARPGAFACILSAATEAGVVNVTSRNLETERTNSSKGYICILSIGIGLLESVYWNRLILTAFGLRLVSSLQVRDFDRK